MHLPILDGITKHIRKCKIQLTNWRSLFFWGKILVASKSIKLTSIKITSFSGFEIGLTLLTTLFAKTSQSYVDSNSSPHFTSQKNWEGCSQSFSFYVLLFFEREKSIFGEIICLITKSSFIRNWIKKFKSDQWIGFRIAIRL